MIRQDTRCARGAATAYIDQAQQDALTFASAFEQIAVKRIGEPAGLDLSKRNLVPER
jgi:hypothetical protein